MGKENAVEALIRQCIWLSGHSSSPGRAVAAPRRHRSKRRQEQQEQCESRYPHRDIATLDFVQGQTHWLDCVATVKAAQ